MRLIDADELYKKYMDKMGDLIACVRGTGKDMSEQAISLLCGSALIREAPTVEMPRWISVKERMPPDDITKVLTYGAPVTHWMPLTKPPKEEEDDSD